jgi:hypothetical protein
MSRNKEPNFGITLDSLSCFKGVIPATPNQNLEALAFIRDGIELFEIPREGLGVPLEILQHGNSVNLLTLYLGLGYLLKNRKITISVSPQSELNLGLAIKPEKGRCKRVEVDYDQLIKENPRTVIAALNNLGWDGYTGIRLYKDRGFTEFGRGFAERVGDLSTFVKDRFMRSLSEARTTHYAKPPIANPNIDLIFNLIQELSASKQGNQFRLETDHYSIRRLKTRSETKGREGRLYITREYVYHDGTKDYTCTCPARVECRHIKEMKAER